jgi:hypothetical protein
MWSSKHNKLIWRENAKGAPMYFTAEEIGHLP